MVALEGTARIAIRALAGLVIGDHVLEEDYTRLADVIELLPSVTERAGLWAELAAVHFANSKSDRGREIVRENLFPILERKGVQDEGPHLDLITRYSAVLYLSHKPSAKGVFSRLDENRREEAYFNVGIFMLRRKSPTDPYEQHENGYKIDYQTVLDIIEVMQELKTDNLIIHLITCICETLVASWARTKYTEEQRQEIVRRLKAVVAAKLPDPLNITHQGYVIAARAQIARTVKTSSAEWESICNEARKLANISDRAFVMALVARAMPPKEHDLCAKTFREANSLVQQVPCSYDQLDRLSDISSIICGADSQLARETIQAAKEKMLSSGDASTGFAKRRFIDTAYKIDPDLAASLASISDDDPARQFRRNEMKRRLELLATL